MHEVHEVGDTKKPGGIDPLVFCMREVSNERDQDMHRAPPNLRGIISSIMKVILFKNIPSVGKEGDVIEVSDGHARNFLLPQNLAVPATQGALQRREAHEKAVSHKSQKELSIAGDLAHRLEGHEVVLKEKVSEGGVFYGAVSGKAVADALKKDGFKVDAAWVLFKTPIKEPGEYQATVSLPHGFESEIRILVESK